MTFELSTDNVSCIVQAVSEKINTLNALDEKLDSIGDCGYIIYNAKQSIVDELDSLRDVISILNQ